MPVLLSLDFESLQHQFIAVYTSQIYVLQFTPTLDLFKINCGKGLNVTKTKWEDIVWKDRGKMGLAKILTAFRQLPPVIREMMFYNILMYQQPLEAGPAHMVASAIKCQFFACSRTHISASPFPLNAGKRRFLAHLAPGHFLV